MRNKSCRSKQNLKGTCQNWSCFYFPKSHPHPWPLALVLAVSPNRRFWSLICISQLPPKYVFLLMGLSFVQCSRYCKEQETITSIQTVFDFAEL